ncbi:TonB-dependent receptor plug [Sphingobium chlorophenolicum L-1]|uniref:TonB-dependent receptor plug n=1 Tax=Sphingobium chlorophenolicum L-1 TaxID=690566 RepID=F6EVG3_SPHCR|nr:TonB-dependent receptor [Sphingobium chlorophenolicum]AEG47967.1 TonB-dependent receptor plug [Sphingobium chlorophenolicum L-1]
MPIRHALAGLALAACLGSPVQLLAASKADTTLSQRHKFDIAPQPLSSALRQLSAQSGVRILFPYDEVAAIRSRRVQGWLSTDDALDRLLAGTAFKHSAAGVGVVALIIPANRSATRRSPMAVQFAQVGAAGGAAPVSMTPGTEAEQAAAPIIVTGTRQTTRTVAESLAPIDVLSARDLEASGKQSVRDLLGTLVPSINVSNSGAGASFAVKTLSLRGLAGDHLLVLVNGKRRHNTATLFINGTTQNGQSPPDLDLIPSSAIERIEVLRDGASAQYGSDAIAGVVNILLKDDASGTASFVGGANADGGGEQGRFQISKGFGIGGGGHVHFTLDAYLQGRTYRSAPNPGPFFARVGQLYSSATGMLDPREATVDRNVNRGGQPQVSGVNFAYDMSLPVNDMVEFYLFGTASRRHSDAWLTYRFPDAPNNIPELFPNGYSPHLHIYDEDFQASAGLRGDLSDSFHYDLSSSFSRDWVKYRENSVLNASLGPASPTDMHIGSVTSKEWTSNLDLRKTVDMGLAEPLLVALGAEYRWNGYAIGAGDPESYVDGGYRSSGGPNAGVLRTSGSQGVTGFPLSSAGKWNRDNMSAYLNLEQQVVEGFEVALAGRHEDYSDFGTTDTGKASLRIEPVRGLALRGTASTGFRAPTLQQQHYSSASTINVGGVLLPVSALPVDSAAAVALGATPLKPEKSRNLSAGIVLTPSPRLNITVDAYQIRIKDRILLSDTLQGPLVRGVLAAAGITSSAGGFYFSNAADTRTRGLDVVSTWRADLGQLGHALFSLSANFNKTVFTHVDAVPSVLADSGLMLIGRAKRGDFTKGTPRDKFIANMLWTRGPASLNLRATRYGKVTMVHPTTPSLDAAIDPKIIVDLEAGVELRKGVRLTAGANNLFNRYPDKLLPSLQGNGFSLYNPYSPYGTSGGFYYGRLNFEF